MSATRIHTPPQTRRKRAYSIVELMITLAILGFVMAGVYAFSTQSTRMLFTSVFRMDTNKDMRNFTQQIQTDIATANTFYIYTSFSASDRDASTDRLAADGSGDCLVLVYDEPQPNSNSTVYITKLVCYFRNLSGITNIADKAPVCRLEIDYADQTVAAAAASNSAESLLAGYTYTSQTYVKALNFAKGGYTNRIFFNLNGSTVMVAAETYRGSDALNTTEMIHISASPRN